MKAAIADEERRRTTESMQRWLLQNEFNVVFALLISVIGWATNHTLSDLREDIEALKEASQALAIEQQSQAERIAFLEKLVAVQAEKQQEYERARLMFWQEYGPALQRTKERR